MVYARRRGVGPAHRAAECIHLVSLDRTLVRCRWRPASARGAANLVLGVALAAAPMTRLHAPAVALPYPLMSDPMIALPAGSPMTRHPLIAAADPVPIAAEPYEPGCGRDADDFFACQWRSHHHDATGIVALIRNNHASLQRRAEDETEKVGRGQATALIHGLGRIPAPASEHHRRVARIHRCGASTSAAATARRPHSPEDAAAAL